MSTLDWVVLNAYFVLMIVVGVYARKKVKSAADFFTAGGNMPWWLSGISHHMSGYSSAVFVGYAAIAYTTGFNLYIWWALSICTAMVIGAFTFAPRWSRLRQRLNIISPTEYLATRYGLPTQQVLAWSGSALKLFDVGAKWTATAILLYVFAQVPIGLGILLTGGVTLIYSVFGGLWADAMTDFSQFIIQLLAGVAMFVAAMMHLGGVSSLWTIWDQLPPSHSQMFNGQYTPIFAIVFLLVNTLSYNGGTWSLAQRFIASPNGSDAKKAALLSAALYLIWPLILFFPMWAAPLILPNLADPSQSYALLTQHLLPTGLIGLVLAGLFAHTMAMTSSDANAVAAVITRDILPVVWKRVTGFSDKQELLNGRIFVFAFIAISMLIALSAKSFGGVIGLILLWYGALIGPIAIPMLFGMLPMFRRCGPNAALASWSAGIVVFILVKYVFNTTIATLHPNWVTTFTVAGPVACSIIIFILVGWLRPVESAVVDRLIDSLADDGPAAAK
ncbi:sodium:solute symporter family protein [Glaciimonas sp. PCH181]|uniref:sodium:solute symporter family protein n=1 Tax=Glaciimonas sp. PCH181 TaxID=2133943 RepID=UPI000D34A8B2|nr:sodium:solute symporter family protein [Glaciimonas sp. PCH181]PUA20048.1 Na+:solute symporter [Glaciimonas sp. PCH181]